MAYILCICSFEILHFDLSPDNLIELVLIKIKSM